MQFVSGLIYVLYSGRVLDSSDARPKIVTDTTQLLREGSCCIGGVDFITMVCLFVPKFTSICTGL